MIEQINKIEREASLKLTAAAEKGRKDSGIVLPAVLWWLGVPLTLVVVLFLLGVL